MTAYVFTGPTLGPAAPEGFVFLPPVAQGDLYRLAVRRPDAIGIVDGRFQDVPAVWHKEILWALAQGIPVYGSASMGALRAAETAAYGTVGVGRIFEAYRDGVLEDDDEVAVAHAGAEDDYRPTSEALVDIRATLEAACRAGAVDESRRDELIGRAKALFYPRRSLRAIGCLELAEFRVEQKRADALEMLEIMREPRTPPPFRFAHTQFFEHSRRGAGVADLLGQDLLDELRLRPAAYAQVRDRAVVRGLSVAVSGRETPPDLAVLQPVIDEFRRERELLDEDRTRRWLADNDLTVGQFAALIREEHAIRRSAPADLVPALRSQLRADGLYPELADRARAKRRLLTGLGLDDAATAPDDGTDGDLLRWFFARLGSEVPGDVAGCARSLGFADEIAFLRAVRRERLFVRHASGDAATTPAEGESS